MGDPGDRGNRQLVFGPFAIGRGLEPSIADRRAETGALVAKSVDDASVKCDSLGGFIIQ